jgi:pimeloyl-ACP methyl ester carboxylesterase
MSVVSLHGTELYYEVHGSSGDPTLLLHGSLVDHRCWDAIVPPLAQNLQVVAYDRRGHGQSTGPTRVHPVRDDAADLAGLLEKTDLYPAHIVAHSYGGAVALRLAIDRPEMVRSLTLHETPFVGLLEDDPVSAEEARRLLLGIRRIQDLMRAGDLSSAVREVVGAFSSESGAWDRLRPEAQQQLIQNASRWSEEFGDPEAIRPEGRGLADLLVPVLLTSGERSPPFLRRVNAALAESLRNVRVLTIPDAGHVPHITSPLQYAGLLLSFLLERNVPTA